MTLANTTHRQGSTEGRDHAMAGRRQPTALVEANGRKHLTEAEADARRDQEVYVPPPDAAVPPRWLPKKLHQEFREIGEILMAAGLYSELDRDVLGQYFWPGSGGSGRTSWPPRRYGTKTRTWLRSGPAHRIPISARPGSARSPWGSQSPPGVGSWSQRRSRMPGRPARRMALTSSPGRCVPARLRRWRRRNDCRYSGRGGHPGQSGR